jgi:hypothetical protein
VKSDTQYLRDGVKRAFSFLVATGSHVVESESNASSITIDWLFDGIAIEVVCDLRDRIVSTFVVRLENGLLPAGYRISNGRQCRWYLADALRMVGVEQTQASARKQRRKTKTSSDYVAEMTAAAMLTDATAQSKIVEASLPVLLRKRQLFY